MPGGRVIGVDVGGTKILAGVVDADGGIERTLDRPSPVESQRSLLDALVAIVRDLDVPNLEAVGFGVPVRVDHRTGGVLGAVNLPLGDFGFRAAMEELLGLRVTVENDASAAALAEHRLGAGRGVDDLVMLTLGSGVGGGVVIGGRLLAGWAELGHVVIVEDGEPCQGICTGRGHVESYCSGFAADRLAERVLGPGATAEDLVSERHPALAGVGRHLGAAIGSLVNIFRPDLVVIGGGFGVAAFDLLVPEAREVMRREVLPAPDEVPVVKAELGVEAGLIGAGLAAWDALG
jgi:glucokinase